MGRKYYHRGNPTSYKPTVKYSTSHHRYTHTAVKSDAPGRVRRRPAGYAVTSRAQGGQEAAEATCKKLTGRELNESLDFVGESA